MANMWIADEDVMGVMRDLISKYHPHLASCDDEIAIVFKEKASKAGEVAIIGKTGKAPAILSVLGDKQYKFLITLAADAWVELSDAQKVALVDHHLCGCCVEENPQDGSLKFFVSPPDVAFYRGELERHGIWRTTGAPPSPNLVKDLFGDEDDGGVVG